MSAALPPEDTPPDERDLLAAEWVLGTLDGTERAEAARLIGADADFAASVAAWEIRLAPLAQLVPSAMPPDGLWPRIASQLPGLATPVRAVGPGVPPMPDQAARMLTSIRRWRVATAASLAIAACLAGFIVVRQAWLPATVTPQRLAVLSPPNGPAVFVVDASAAGLRVFPTAAITVADGRDLELWALREGSSRPESLGVLPAAGRIVPMALPAGTQVLVSLEPRGGSPTGQPTGPVVYAGRLSGPG